MRIAIWQGTSQELRQLREAVELNCECVLAANDTPGVVCAAHAMLVDQCLINHLLYGYRLRAIFIRGEFSLDNDVDCEQRGAVDDVFGSATEVLMSELTLIGLSSSALASSRELSSPRVASCASASWRVNVRC